MEIVAPPSWYSAIDDILSSPQQPKIIMVIGPVDSGKTTFCRWFINRILDLGIKAAIIDADLGQSHIGLPGTIGLGIITRHIESLEAVKPLAIYFVGSISPVAHFLPTIIGTKKLLDKALRECVDIVIIDTDGLVFGTQGTILKQYQFTIIEPTHVIVLEKANELHHIRQLWQSVIWTKVISIEISSVAKSKSLEERRIHRHCLYKKWISSTHEKELFLDEVVFWNSWLRHGKELSLQRLQEFSDKYQVEVLYGEQVGSNFYLVSRQVPTLMPTEQSYRLRWYLPHQYTNIFVGLVDQFAEFIGAAILLEIDFVKRKLKLITNEIEDRRKSQIIVMGSLRLSPEGVEQGRIQPGAL